MPDLGKALDQSLLTTLFVVELKHLYWIVSVMVSLMLAPVLTLMMLVWNVRKSVQLVTFDCEEDPLSMKAESRSVLTVCGAQSVMISGELLMLQWPVDSLDTLNTV